MNDEKLSYTIIQCSPHPESFEFVNVGVIVFDARNSKYKLKCTSDFSRVKAAFDVPNLSFLKMALPDFVDRCVFEYSKSGSSIFNKDFNAKAVNVFRTTSVMPIMGKDVEALANSLYQELVARKLPNKRRQRIETRLSEELSDAGVLSLLDKRPAAVNLPQYGIDIKAAFGYQNGTYNLIDPARFDEPENALREAGKRILEGRSLAETVDHRLIVVGDFGEQPENFVSSVMSDFRDAKVEIFSFKDVDRLAEKIRAGAHFASMN